MLSSAITRRSRVAFSGHLMSARMRLVLGVLAAAVVAAGVLVVVNRDPEPEAAALRTSAIAPGRSAKRADGKVAGTTMTAQQAADAAIEDGKHPDLVPLPESAFTRPIARYRAYAAGQAPWRGGARCGRDAVDCARRRAAPPRVATRAPRAARRDALRPLAARRRGLRRARRPRRAHHRRARRAPARPARRARRPPLAPPRAASRRAAPRRARAGRLRDPRARDPRGRPARPDGRRDRRARHRRQRRRDARGDRARCTTCSPGAATRCRRSTRGSTQLETHAGADPPRARRVARAGRRCRAPSTSGCWASSAPRSRRWPTCRARSRRRFRPTIPALR